MIKLQLKNCLWLDVCSPGLETLAKTPGSGPRPSKLTVGPRKQEHHATFWWHVSLCLSEANLP